jgi:hypothetical protein
MKRSILTSVALITAAASLVTLGTTGALFNDTRTASGVIAAAGSIDLWLNDGSPECGDSNPVADEITFEGPEDLLPGESKTCLIELENVGTDPFHVDVTGADTSASLLDVCDGPGPDFTVTVTKGTDTDSDDPDAHTARVEPGVFDAAAITVTFNASASNDCQGGVVFVSVAFTAASIP